MTHLKGETMRVSQMVSLDFVELRDGIRELPDGSRWEWLSISKIWQCVFAQPKSEKIRYKEALQKIASMTCQVPDHCNNNENKCVTCIAREALK